MLLLFPFRGVLLRRQSINHCSIIREKEFSRKDEMSKVEFFYWKKLSNESFSFELEQFFDLCNFLTVQGGCIDNI